MVVYVVFLPNKSVDWILLTLAPRGSKEFRIGDDEGDGRPTYHRLT